ncbi:hypothetical protein [Streptomyces sp. 061-3]|uniref:hypothetical protein n=1 Tax=Streptomyces sp. 061-3 TaxID=2789268 RepID=UPI00397F13F7
MTVASPVPVGDPQVRFVSMQWPPTKYRARFDPDLDTLVAAIRAARPDVVVANQVEIAPAIRAALLEAKIDAQIVGYCHYLPFFFTEGQQLAVAPALDDRSLGRPVMLAFGAGLAACDRVLVHSATAASWTSAAASRMSVDLSGKLHVVLPPRDERLARDLAEVAAPPW